MKVVSPENPAFGSKLNVPSALRTTVPSGLSVTSSNVAGASPGSSLVDTSPVTVWPKSPAKASSIASGCSSGFSPTVIVTTAVSVSPSESVIR